MQVVIVLQQLQQALLNFPYLYALVTKTSNVKVLVCRKR